MLMNVKDVYQTYPQSSVAAGNKALDGKSKGAKEKVQDLLSKKYSNAEVFIGSEKQVSSLGYSKDYQSEKEYSIILSEDEMNLLASTDPKDRKAQDKLYAQIDSAMKDAEKLGEDVGANEDLANVLQVGVTIGTDGKSYYFAKTEEGGFQVDSRENLMSMLLEKVSQAKTASQDAAE